ncbi:regulatory signaling modulator protein AmpE [Rhodoferax antarcticus]|uniref:Cobalamin biosynthesis protein CobD n=1 Tax=Rhodoferax antarcticus ANT.BR TaxID=1111071 RepID=A0A1Q8YD63_9BURK|nr:regulatory signaling modulator protein AmpE [Rhodoferax antarcticus]APW45884.1 cobalamin biosynthesis protein CbiB [Rhodoferax antarcticus]OLP05986.1 cobalamin biosynthesis protein CobD 2 [Rhodoferax antarcticus ANT.BR]
MSFISVILALLLEQARPLKRGNIIHASMRAWVRWCTRTLDAGRPMHGWLVWGLAVGGPALAALAIYLLLQFLVGWPLAVLWSALVLYASLGFRQFSFHFTQIRDALAEGDDALANRLLADWLRTEAIDLPRTEIIGRVIENSVLASHRHVFAVLVWFSVLAALGLGPLGAVLYRLAEFVVRYWQHQSESNHQPVSVALMFDARKAWDVVDWLPARATAISFAVVGNFEEAIDAWRRYAQQGSPSNDGLVLAATGGAVNIALRGTDTRPYPPTQAAAAPLLDDVLAGRPTPELPHLAIVVGLVWRTVVMWVLLLALLTLARLLG